jgi:hypothetical protein
MMAQLNDITTLARLDKTGTKVLCGYRLYNGKFCAGPIGTLKHAERLIDGGFWAREQHLCFEPGFGLDADGVWRETTYAYRGRQRGYPPKFRTSPLRALARKRGAHGYADMPGLPHDGRGERRITLERTADAECPFCHRVQKIDFDALGVVFRIVLDTGLPDVTPDET